MKVAFLKDKEKIYICVVSYYFYSTVLMNVLLTFELNYTGGDVTEAAEGRQTCSSR